MKWSTTLFVSTRLYFQDVRICFLEGPPSTPSVTSSIHSSSSAPLLVVRRSRHQSSHLFWRRWSVIIDPCVHILCSSPRRPQVPSPIVSPVLEEMVRHHRSMRTHPLLLSSSSAGLVTNRLTCFEGDGPSSSIHAYTSSAPLLVVRRSRHQSSHLF